ncbi:hypothetical protein LAZ67_2002222 [Cordylochernes scorpioides]|uniref:Uncharacterized protein n=1 Tax=Cordylochernes scorpioides TaxID=51811 RepID=A0ABY6K6L9_9ARAC|nr:hypothetical protein LAZ67_2002222 [Cordylochernes scorpioides]
MDGLSPLSQPLAQPVWPISSITASMDGLLLYLSQYGWPISSISASSSASMAYLLYHSQYGWATPLSQPLAQPVWSISSITASLLCTQLGLRNWDIFKFPEFSHAGLKFSGTVIDYRTTAMDLSPQHSAGPQDLKTFNYLLVASQILGAAAIVLSAVWTDKFLGGLGWYSSQNQQFNYHPLFMVLGMVLFYGERRLAKLNQHLQQSEIPICTPVRMSESFPSNEEVERAVDEYFKSSRLSFPGRNTYTGETLGQVRDRRARVIYRKILALTIPLDEREPAKEEEDYEHFGPSKSGYRLGSSLRSLKKFKKPKEVKEV